MKDQKEIWKFIQDVANGLSYLHTNNPVIIHQDIKPANILIDKRGNYVITDFGISTTSVCNDVESIEKNSGTFAYMAPERFDYGSSDTSCDIWSLGATLYEILTGTPPYGQGGGGAQMDGAKRQGKLSGIPSSVKKLISACLDPNPKNRPTAQDLVLAAQNKKFPLSNSYFNKIINWGFIGIVAIIIVISIFVMFVDHQYNTVKETENRPETTIFDPYTIVYTPEEPEFNNTTGISEEFLVKYKEYYLYVQSPDFCFSEFQKILDWKWLNISSFQKLDKNEHFQWRLTALDVIRKTLLKNDDNLSSDLAHREYGKYADEKYIQIFSSPVVREAILRTYLGFQIKSQSDQSKDISHGDGNISMDGLMRRYNDSESNMAMKEARAIIRKGGKISDFLFIPQKIIEGSPN